MKKNLLLTWREAPKIFGVFSSGAKRRKFFEAYLCCNLENCLPPPPLFQCQKYWEIIHTPFMRYSLVYYYLKLPYNWPPSNNWPTHAKRRKKIFPKLFFSKKLFSNFFFTPELSHFLGTNNLNKNIFSKKKEFDKTLLFWILCPPKVTKFCSTKTNQKKNIFVQKIFWKMFFLEKNIFFEFFVVRKWLSSKKHFWKYKLIVNFYD
jgi:hypothetical protein